MSLQKNILLIIAFSCIPILVSAQNNTGMSTGERLFRDNCSACHKIGKELIGPDLSGIRSRMPEEWIIKFVQNSQLVILGRDPYAIKLFNDYKQVIMPETKLTENEILEILKYVTCQEKIVPVQVQTNVYPVVPEGRKKTGLLTFLLQARIIVITIILLIFTFLFIFPWIIKLLKKDAGKISSAGKTIYDLGFFFKKQVAGIFYVISLSIIILIILVPVSRNHAVQTGIMQPQPVVFSHFTHYDTFSTDCSFCHPGAKKSEFAGLPGINNCMKCHSFITEGKKYGKTELLKLTNIYKSKKNISWATGYRFSDYVHFNHSVHTVTAKIDCTTCHTRTDNMECRKNSFSMKWCIDCHKTTAIDKNGKYYRKILDSVLVRQKQTVSELGGMDCNGCHY